MKDKYPPLWVAPLGGLLIGAMFSGLFWTVSHIVASLLYGHVQYLPYILGPIVIPTVVATIGIYYDIEKEKRIDREKEKDSTAED